jgi:uncharacterized membrane protein YccC
MRSMTQAGAPGQGSPVALNATFATRLAHSPRVAGPPLFFGLRLWVSVCLALYLAFWLELDNPYWAGTTAALVCQPHLGASLRKGWYRMIGTVVGAVAIVVLTACFPQNRVAFLVGLALWGAGCVFVATILRNSSLALAAQLAGITAAIIASSELGATGGANGDVFILAVIRCTEICIGIVSAGVVLLGTDFGNASRRLATLFADISAEIAGGFTGTLAVAGSELPDTQPARSELIRRVIALDPVIDEAFGESAQLRYHSAVLQTAVNGLIAAIAGWRVVWVHLTRRSDNQAGQEAGVVLRSLPQELRSAQHGKPLVSMADPTGLRRICEAAIGTLAALPAATPSLRLLTDQTAAVLAGISHALIGLAMLTADPAGPVPHGYRVRLHVPDWLPSLVNAGRVFVTIGAIELFWIITQWPNGALAITFAVIGVILFSPRADQAYAGAVGFVVGTGLTAALAAVIAFAVLPGKEGFAAFSIAIGLVLVPAGAGVAQPWQTPMFTAMTAFFSFLLAPTNLMSYDVIEFYNRALAIVAGLGIAALSFRLLPPLSPAFRTRRLMTLTLRDLRRLALGPIPQKPADWEGRMYSRLCAMPDAAAPLQRAQLVTALSVGSEIIQLRLIARRLGLGPELDAALEAVARGDSAMATTRLGQLDGALAARPDAAALQVRGSMLAISEGLIQHATYFDAGAPG